VLCAQPRCLRPADPQVHHDLRGFRKNYSQPYFTHWDWLLGTYLDPADLHKAAARKPAARPADTKKDS
jgi:sphinganine C4-monooxygenase